MGPGYFEVTCSVEL